MKNSPGIVVIWNDILPEERHNFLDWHSREHIPERVSIPGFTQGQRWFNADSCPQYLTIYHTTDTSVLTSAAYLDRLNNPTPWTRRSVAAFRNTARAAGRLVWQSSGSSGGFVLTARLEVEHQAAEALAQHWSAGNLNTLAQAPGVARVMVALATPSASRLQTAERAVRSGDLREPALTVLVEGFDGVEALRAAFDAATLNEPALATARVDLYALQVDLRASDQLTVTGPSKTLDQRRPAQQSTRYSGPLTLESAMSRLALTDERSPFKRDAPDADIEYRDLGLSAATGGQIGARHIRAILPFQRPTGWHWHDMTAHINIVLRGWIRFRYEGVGDDVTVQAGECLSQPAGVPHNVIGRSTDLELIEINIPAEFATVDLGGDPAAPQPPTRSPVEGG